MPRHGKSLCSNLDANLSPKVFSLTWGWAWKEESAHCWTAWSAGDVCPTAGTALHQMPRWQMRNHCRQMERCCRQPESCFRQSESCFRQPERCCCWQLESCCCCCQAEGDWQRRQWPPAAWCIPPAVSTARSVHCTKWTWFTKKFFDFSFLVSITECVHHCLRRQTVGGAP